jgi:tetratricopeptide (TPR) repeat protein
VGEKEHNAAGLVAGGPSTARGVNFQAKYAVLRAFQAIQQHLASPTSNPIVQPEARVGDGEFSTQWDVRVSVPNELAEVKSSPARKDVIEFLDRVLVAERQPSPKCSYLFVYGRGGNALLNALEQLRRTATEARGDATDFERLRRIKDIPKADELLARLGAGAVAVLSRIKLDNLTEGALDSVLASYASALAGNQASQLTDLAFFQLSHAATARAGLAATELVELARSRGIAIRLPPDLDLPDEEKELSDALAVLQAAADGLPIEILGQSVRQSPAILERKLDALSDRQLLSQNGGRWRVVPFLRKLTASSPDVSTAALRAVLSWIESRKGQPIPRADIMCALTLAEAAVTDRPEAVARIFITLDKPLKRLGDKHLVLAAADLAIDAARAARPRPNDVIEGEAQALICGRSWVFQRINRLDEARAAASISLRLGQAIGWDRNTAFCEKCIGRLCRIEAETPEKGDRRTELLKESTAHLETAISAFTAMGNMPEVGDCWSLLGRTQLVSGRTREAVAAAEKAKELVVDFESKDYFDLLILVGDLAAVRRDFQAAEAFYSDAVKLQATADSERSEILARAYYQRGKSYAAQHRNGPAIRDFHKAAAIWQQLDEPEMESKSAWEEMRLSIELPNDLLAALRDERAAIKVRVVRIYQERMKATAGKSTSKRMKSPGGAFWTELIKQARRQEVSESPEW